jgi:hypothetical protein
MGRVPEDAIDGVADEGLLLVVRGPSQFDQQLAQVRSRMRETSGMSGPSTRSPSTSRSAMPSTAPVAATRPPIGASRSVR